MKRLLLAGVALVAISSFPAAAADMRARPATKAPPMVAAMPMWNWTGFYVGGQVGYQWATDDHSHTSVTPGFGTTGPFLYDSDGAVYGGHAGFNWQVGQWVWGIEGDWEGSGVDGGFTLATSTLGGTAGDSIAFEQKWQASLRGRLGWAAWDRTLLYVTGGIAWSKFDVAFAAPSVGFAETLSDTLSGWTIGAGAEWAFWDNWSARVEYRYTDFDSFSRPTTVLPLATTISVDDVSYHTVRFGVSYRFGGFGKDPVGKGPVVSRY